jgi:predicted nucleic acid-binding protein
VRRLIARASALQRPLYVPAVVVAETIRGNGPRDAPVERLLAKAREIMATDGSVARLAGALLAAARSNATIDAIVIAHALKIGGGLVVTSDPQDLRALVPSGSRIRIHPV